MRGGLSFVRLINDSAIPHVSSFVLEPHVYVIKIPVCLTTEGGSRDAKSLHPPQPLPVEVYEQITDISTTIVCSAIMGTIKK